MICGQNVLRLKRWRDPCSGRSLFFLFFKTVYKSELKFDQYIYIRTEKGKDKRQQTRSNEWIFKLPQVVTFGRGLKEKKRRRKRERLPLLFFFIQSFCQRQRQKKKPKKTKGVPKWINVHFLPIHTHTWVCVCVYIYDGKKKEKLDGSKIA